MKRRIFWNMGLLILLTVLLFAALWGLLFSRQFSSQIMGGMETLRVTLMDENGVVTFDNMAGPETMENHAGRPEVQDALRSGSGRGERTSGTTKRTTRYYAVRVGGGTILRLAFTTDALSSLMAGFIPAVLLCLAAAACLAVFAARRLTRAILAPINAIDLDSPENVEYDELLPFVKKIAAQKKEITAQVAALQTRADTITAITENMTEGLILLDRAGTVLTANKAAAGLFGDAAGQNILRVCRDIAFAEGVKRSLAGENESILFERGGRIHSVHFSPVRNGVGGAVILFFDVTERHESEKQRREFSANVSHELKTPLTSISALSEMMENGMAKNEDIKGFAARISDQAKRLVHIVDDIIKLSEFDEGKAGREQEVFDLYELAETVTDALRENALRENTLRENALRENERNVEIQLTGERFSIMANRRMVDELLYNLLDNGVKYNRDGGRVTVALSREDGFCKIAVSDTGIGIPEAHQSRVFERFYRADKSRSKKTGGTGLGLSIVKHIAEYHGGRVELNSAEGEGTTVTCWLAARE